MAVVKNQAELPVEYAREIIRGVVGRSKALELGRRLPDMNAKTLKLNVLSNLPVAGWIKNSQTTPNAESTEINRKPISTLAWANVDVVAEEIAVIVLDHAELVELTVKCTDRDISIDLGVFVVNRQLRDPAVIRIRRIENRNVIPVFRKLTPCTLQHFLKS